MLVYVWIDAQRVSKVRSQVKSSLRENPPSRKDPEVLEGLNCSLIALSFREPQRPCLGTLFTDHSLNYRMRNARST